MAYLILYRERSDGRLVDTFVDTDKEALTVIDNLLDSDIEFNHIRVYKVEPMNIKMSLESF